MSWYVDLQGRKVWIEDNESVYTVDDPTEDLPCETLNYLTTGSRKADVFQEHSIDEPGKTSKRKGKEKPGGQRGFVVRVEQDERTRVGSNFQAAADALVRSGVVSRIDIDEQGRKKLSDEERAACAALASNECHLATTARCRHFAHGAGFRVEISERDSIHRINLFTGQQELSGSRWHDALMEALKSSGTRVMEGRLSPAVGGDPPEGARGGRAGGGGGGGGDGGGGGRGGSTTAAPTRKVDTQEEEEDWLATVMGNSMASVGTKEPGRAKDGEDAPEGEDAAGEASGDAVVPEKAKTRPKPVLPPWLQKA